VSDFERETRTTTVETPTSDSVTYVRSGSGAGPWILAAVVAVIAIIAVVWMMNSRTAPTDNEISAAMDQSRAAGYVEGASTALSNVPPQTTLPAPVDTGSVIASQQAAADARAAAERAANSAQSAATSASANSNTDASTNTTP
jgi:hypothetical protein